VAYCTQANIEERYSEQSVVAYADHNKDGTADADVITRAITDACGLMDSYLQKQFVVPVPAPIPPSLRDCAITLAWCRLLRGRQSMTEEERLACKEALDWLKAVAAGEIEIGLVPKPTASASAPGVRYQVDDREFGRDKDL